MRREGRGDQMVKHAVRKRDQTVIDFIWIFSLDLQLHGYPGIRIVV
jgi:hypothetical protein